MLRLTLRVGIQLAASQRTSSVPASVVPRRGGVPTLTRAATIGTERGASNWFDLLFGFRENAAAVRENFEVTPDGFLHSRVNDATFAIGRFGWRRRSVGTAVACAELFCARAQRRPP
jgi:hypothetical protein